jgi:hypothetical protein
MQARGARDRVVKGLHHHANSLPAIFGCASQTSQHYSVNKVIAIDQVEEELNKIFGYFQTFLLTAYIYV